MKANRPMEAFVLKNAQSKVGAGVFTSHPVSPKVGHSELPGRHGHLCVARLVRPAPGLKSPVSPREPGSARHSLQHPFPPSKSYIYKQGNSEHLPTFHK